MVRKTVFFLVNWIIFAKIVGRDRVRVAPRYSNWAWSFKGGTVRQERQDASGCVRMTLGLRQDGVRMASG